MHLLPKEERMNELLHANVPKVRFRLPRLEPARFQDRNANMF